MDSIQRIRTFSDSIEFPKHLDPQAKSFISCCLRKSPYKRWNIAKLLKHPYLALDVKKEKYKDEVGRIIEMLCTSTFIQNLKEDLLLNNKDLDSNSMNHCNTTQTPNPKPQTPNPKPLFKVLS